jgi:hypothetical protein
MQDLLDNVFPRGKSSIIDYVSRTNPALASAAFRVVNDPFAFKLKFNWDYAGQTSLSVQRRGVVVDTNGIFTRYVLAIRPDDYDKDRRRFDMVKQDGGGGNRKLAIDKDGSLTMHGVKHVVAAGMPVRMTPDTCRIDIMIESALLRIRRDVNSNGIQQLHHLLGGSESKCDEILLHKWLDTKVIHEKPEGLLQYERAAKRSRTYTAII